MQLRRLAISVSLAAGISACAEQGDTPEKAPSEAVDAAALTASDETPGGAGADASPKAEGSVGAEQVAAQPPLRVAPPDDAQPMPASFTEVCDDIAALANDARAKGERFYAITAPSGSITIPDWRPLDYRANVELIVGGLYDGWCEELARVNDRAGAPLTDGERARCNTERKATLRDGVGGDARLQSAMIDIDRDGDDEKTYQLFPDPAAALSGDPAWTLWTLQPRVFVSASEDPATHRQLHRTLFAPEASLFFRNQELYALRAWNGAPDRYEIFQVTSAAGRLGQIPLCQLTSEG